MWEFEAEVWRGSMLGFGWVVFCVGTERRRIGLDQIRSWEEKRKKGLGLVIICGRCVKWWC